MAEQNPVEYKNTACLSYVGKKCLQKWPVSNKRVMNDNQAEMWLFIVTFYLFIYYFIDEL